MSVVWTPGPGWETYVPPPPPSPSPTLTHLKGNGLTHDTDVDSVRVWVFIEAPVGGSVQGRPTLNGVPIAATAGGAPIVLQSPGVVSIVTTAANNDLLIIEERT